MRAILLGAGFSKWAADLPLASQLFDFKLRLRSDREEKRARLVERDWCDWRKDHPDGSAEQFIAWALEQSRVRKERIVWYVTRRLSDPFLCKILGGVATYMIDDSRVRNLDGIRRAQSILQKFIGDDTSGMLTTNYDLLPEYALTSSHFNYGVVGEQLTGRGKNPVFPWQGAPVSLTGRVRLAKLHGSVSWDGASRYTDGRAGLNGRAQIVPPYPEKEAPAALAPTWDLARDILRHTTQLVVFGFAFNPYDEAILELLGSAGARVAEVLLINLDKRTDHATQIWPKALVRCEVPPEPVTSSIEHWFATRPSRTT